MRYSPASVLRNLFFFQAEDGIRATSVTGVQTCALPIYGSIFDELHERERNVVAVPSRRDLDSDLEARRAVDRKSVVEGKSVDLGGRRSIKKERSQIKKPQETRRNVRTPKHSDEDATQPH